MFIVLESIDGGGKGKQREELVEFLREKGVSVKTAGFPDHNTAIWNSYLHPALHGEMDLNAGGWFSAFAFEKFLWQDELIKYKGDPKNLFIADGYYTTTLVYQCILQNKPTLEFGLKFAEELDVVRPDLAIYLDVTPKTAMIRKKAEEGKEERDIYESDLEKQRWIRGAFQRMVEEQIWCQWVHVDGNGTIEEVRDLVLAEIRNLVTW